MSLRWAFNGVFHMRATLIKAPQALSEQAQGRVRTVGSRGQGVL